MATERAIGCDCGARMEMRRTLLDEIETEAMVCSACGFTTLTKRQAKEYALLRQLHAIIDAERKIIRIGNSMGLTLPDAMRTMGVTVGRRVRTEALGPNSFKVELLEATGPRPETRGKHS